MKPSIRFLAVVIVFAGKRGGGPAAARSHGEQSSAERSDRTGRVYRASRGGRRGGNSRADQRLPREHAAISLEETAPSA